jgi:hypothetical protein
LIALACLVLPLAFIPLSGNALIVAGSVGGMAALILGLSALLLRFAPAPSRPAEEVREKPDLPRTAEEVSFPSRPTDPLTAVEHAQAKELAYYRSLARGGDREPPWDQAQADEDFRHAAADVVRRRPPPP